MECKTYLTNQKMVGKRVAGKQKSDETSPQPKKKQVII